MDDFLNRVKALETDDELLDFCRGELLHGEPNIFEGRESGYYEFRKIIAEQFDISFHEIYITGSAKLGFSPIKRTQFGLDSDIDVSLISNSLFEKFMEHIRKYQMQLRENRIAVTEREINTYHKFLEYIAMGWMRPDLLPLSFDFEEIKEGWFDFFDSISYGKSVVGNYKVNAGLFKTYRHFELYTFSGLKSLHNRLKIENEHE